MRKTVYFLALAGLLAIGPSCSKSSAAPDCGTHNGQQLQLGPQGGCYYINSQGNKEYVPRSECKC